MTPRAFCESDRNEVDAKLPELPELWAWLAASIGDPAKSTMALRVPFGPSVPIRVDVDALMRLIVDVLVSWHGRVAEVKQLTPPDLGYARAVALTKGWMFARNSALTLERHLSVLLSLDYAKMSRPAPIINVMPGTDLPDTITTNGAYETHELDGAWAGNEILRVHHLCRQAVGATEPKPERLAGVPCRRRSCDAFTLRRAVMPEKPDETVFWSQCDRCGDLMTEVEYRSWTKRYAIYASTGEFPVE